MSWAIWITGLPGSGKSTLTRAAAARLAERGVPPVVLELDAMRAVVTPRPTYGAAEREIVYRALVFAAVTLTEIGIPVLIDATAHRRAWRDRARASIAKFAEVQLTCALDVCRAREASRPPGRAPRGIYPAARQPGATVPGVDVPYESAAAAELTVDTEATPAPVAAEMIVSLALALGPARRGPSGDGGAVVWLTGPPGSGKTTLASRLVAALDGDGIDATLLDWQTLRPSVLGGGWVPPTADDIAHRTLIYVAKLLAESGLVVVVDAAAPRRAWRALARTLIDAFAEVQLVCPLEVCGDRERAVRWRPCPCPSGGGVPAAPADVLDYEPSLDPDLVVDTHTRSEWTATDDLLRLARRLRTRRRIPRG